MSLWMVRGDKYGQQQDMALDKRIAYARFVEVPDLSKATTREEVLELCRKAFPEGSEARLRNYAAQLFAFAHRIKKGDLVAMPLRAKPQIAIGRAIV